MKFNTIEVLIFEPLIDSKYSHETFVSVINVQKDHNDMNG